nr:FAD-dependent oxidoreductase [Agriterribacter sp.]
MSGLALAFFLQKKGIKTTVIEASGRLGGRIYTVAGALGTPLELGATWFSNIHQHLPALTEELHLTKYPQYSEGISLFQTKSFEAPQKCSSHLHCRHRLVKYFPLFKPGWPAL